MGGCFELPNSYKIPDEVDSIWNQNPLSAGSLANEISGLLESQIAMNQVLEVGRRGIIVSGKFTLFAFVLDHSDDVSDHVGLFSFDQIDILLILNCEISAVRRGLQNVNWMGRSVHSSYFGRVNLWNLHLQNPSLSYF